MQTDLSPVWWARTLRTRRPVRASRGLGLRNLPAVAGTRRRDRRPTGGRRAPTIRRGRPRWRSRSLMVLVTVSMPPGR